MLRKKLLIFLFSLFVWGWHAPTSNAEIVDQIVAEVNGEIITYSELKRILDPIYAQYSKVYGGDELISRIRKAREQALEQLIENKLILQEAIALGVEMSDKAVVEKIHEIKSRFKNEGDLLAVLKAEGTSYESFSDQVREQLLIKAFISKEVTSKVVVSPREIEAFYVTHKKSFSDQAKVHLFHIMIRKNPENALLAKETALQIATTLELGEESFEELAKNFSEGPSAEKGGDLGFVSRGQLILALEEAAFSLEEGELSDLIEIDEAYHILWAKEVEPLRTRTLKEVADQVENEVFRDKASKIHLHWIASLKKKSFINIFE